MIGRYKYSRVIFVQSDVLSESRADSRRRNERSKDRESRELRRSCERKSRKLSTAERYQLRAASCEIFILADKNRVSFIFDPKNRKPIIYIILRRTRILDQIDETIPMRFAILIDGAIDQAIGCH